MTFSQMSEAIKKAKEKFAKDGRSLGMGFFGSPIALAEHERTDNDLKTMMIIGTCNMTRMSYGESIDPDTQMGFGIGMVPYGSLNSLPASGENKKSAPAL